MAVAGDKTSNLAGDIISKTLMVLPKLTYNIIVALIHEMEIDTMFVTKTIGKICAYELFLMGDKVEGSSSKNNLALNVNTKERERRRRRRRRLFNYPQVKVMMKMIKKRVMKKMPS
uniref:Uncharacterized protein n=1 Tax=Arundo donax TaxID=35708 RepID=A0A0A8Z6I1_ARUDO